VPATFRRSVDCVSFELRTAFGFKVSGLGIQQLTAAECLKSCSPCAVQREKSMCDFVEQT
jgi:hypothetical protein